MNIGDLDLQGIAVPLGIAFVTQLVAVWLLARGLSSPNSGLDSCLTYTSISFLISLVVLVVTLGCAPITDGEHSRYPIQPELYAVVAVCWFVFSLWLPVRIFDFNVSQMVCFILLTWITSWGVNVLMPVDWWKLVSQIVPLKEVVPAQPVEVEPKAPVWRGFIQ